MNVTYGISEEIYHLGNSKRISYGIVAYFAPNKDDSASIVASAYDITSDKNKIEELVSLCNRLGLSSVHLADVVEDFLAS